MSEMSSDGVEMLPDESTARNLVKAWFREFPGTIDPLLEELAASAVHDGMEIKESMLENHDDDAPVQGGASALRSWLYSRSNRQRRFNTKGRCVV